jgi:cytolysin (calcineurin-like family phosphatase)
MTWSYSSNPAENELDMYRFSIGDTISDESILQDEEINFILGKYISHEVRMYKLLEAATNILARDIKKSLGPQSQDPTERLKHFQQEATKYRALAGISGISIPVYSSDKVFTKGMHDNV